MNDLPKPALRDSEIANFLQRATANGLDELAPVIMPYLKRRILVGYQEADLTQNAHSRLGGWPNVSEQFVWPRSQQGKYMHFLLQLNLTEIAGIQSLLPSQRLLLFFLGGNARNPEGKILYYPADTHLKPYQLPAKTKLQDYDWGIAEFATPGLSEFLSEQVLLSAHPFRVRFEPVLSIPDPDSRFLVDAHNTPLAELLEDRDEFYLDLMDDLMNPPEKLTLGMYQVLLGYDYVPGEDPRDMGDLHAQGMPKGELLLSFSPCQHGFFEYINSAFDFVVAREQLAACNFEVVYVQRFSWG